MTDPGAEARMTDPGAEARMTDPGPKSRLVSPPLARGLMKSAVLLALAIAAAAAAYRLDGPAPAGRALIALGAPEAGLALLEAPADRGVALYRAGRWDEAAEAFRLAGPAHAYDRGNALARAGRYPAALAAYDASLAADPRDGAAAANRAIVAALIERAASKPGDELKGGGAATTEKKSRPGEPEGDEEDQLSVGDGMAGDREAGSASDAPGGSKVSRKGATDTKAEASGDGQARGAATDSDGVGKASVTEAVIAKAFEDVRKREFGKSYDALATTPTRQWLTTLIDDPGRYLKLRIRAEQARRREGGGGS